MISANCQRDMYFQPQVAPSFVGLAMTGNCAPQNIPNKNRLSFREACTGRFEEPALLLSPKNALAGITQLVFSSHESRFTPACRRRESRYSPSTTRHSPRACRGVTRPFRFSQSAGLAFNHFRFQTSNMKTGFLSPLATRHSPLPSSSHPVFPPPERRRRDTQLAHRVSGGKKAARRVYLLRCFSRATPLATRPRPMLPSAAAFHESRFTSHESRFSSFTTHQSPLTNHAFITHSYAFSKRSPFFLRSGVFSLCPVRTKGPVLSRGCFHYISTHSALPSHPSRERSKEATPCKEVPFVN